MCATRTPRPTSRSPKTAWATRRQTSTPRKTSMSSVCTSVSSTENAARTENFHLSCNVVVFIHRVLKLYTYINIVISHLLRLLWNKIVGCLTLRSYINKILYIYLLIKTYFILYYNQGRKLIKNIKLIYKACLMCFFSFLFDFEKLWPILWERSVKKCLWFMKFISLGR